MSFAALAVRTCLVQALRGKTLAGDQVLDSPPDPVDLAARTKLPVISVSSDHEMLRPKGRSFQAGSDDPDVPHANTVDVTLFVFLPPNPALPVPGQSGAAIDAREAGAAFAFDLMWRQIVRALAFDAWGEGGAWADLWRRAVNGVVAVEHSSYIGTLGEDVHMPAREIAMRLDVLDEPAFGPLQGDFWPDFVDQARACEDMADVVPAIEAALSDGGLPEWRALASLLGLRPADMVSVSLGPLGGGPADPIVSLVEVAVDGRIVDDPGVPLLVTP